MKVSSFMQLMCNVNTPNYRPEIISFAPSVPYASCNVTTYNSQSLHQKTGIHVPPCF